MHPITAGRLAYNLPSRQSESSFPERHIYSEPDEIETDHDHHQDHPLSYSQSHPQPGFPKLDFVPSISSFWQESWLDQSQPTHRPHHQHHAVSPVIYGGVEVPVSCHLTRREQSIDRLTSPHHQHHHSAHDIFASSPIRPPQHDVEWEILRATTLPAPGPDLPWLSTLHTGASPKIKTEDDSDSNWSLNDNSNDNSSEDLQLPQLVRPHIQSLRRRAGAGASKVSKVSRHPPTPTSFQHTFRMSTKPTSGAARASNITINTNGIETIDLCGPSPTPTPTTGESPDDFAAKMMERRIAHKLSEKSRRNRLTAAIREIQKLMPLDGTELANSEVAGIYPHFSKVDVAEMAIGYIRKLKRENEELKRKGREREEKDKEREREKEERDREKNSEKEGLEE